MRDKKLFIKELAKFLVENQVGKSIGLELSRRHPPIPPLPNFAHEWAALRGTTPLCGYPDVDEAEKQLADWLGVSL